MRAVQLSTVYEPTNTDHPEKTQLVIEVCQSAGAIIVGILPSFNFSYHSLKSCRNN